jgi:SAM-dependent methyltransferase
LWELEPSPYGDLFCVNIDDAKKLPKNELTLQMCVSCKFIQLGQEVDINEIYKNYRYNLSSTPKLANFFNKLSNLLINLAQLKPSDLIIDVGSGDGTGLLPYLIKGFNVLGIEPSKLPFEKSISSGIPAINDYLNDISVSNCMAQFGKAKLVMANYLSANVPDPVTFFTNLKSLLCVDGMISIVTGYHPDQFSINMFEYINHDHQSYFSVTSAVKLANQSGLKLVSAEKIEHKGGSIHLLFTHAESNTLVTESISQLSQRENWMQIDQPKFYEFLKKRIQQASLIAQNNLPTKGLIGLGASISTTHLLHQFQLGDRFEALLDDDLNKVSRYSPGFAIQVNPMKIVKDYKTNHVVVLAWQHALQIEKNIREYGYVGSVYRILPFFSGVKYGK